MTRGPGESAEAYLRRQEENRLAQARQYRRGADLAREKGNTSLAALNYRRAVSVAPNSEDGQAAREWLTEYFSDAEQKLREAEELIASGSASEAQAILRGLKKDYGELAIAPQIDRASARLRRLKGNSDDSPPRLVASPSGGPECRESLPAVRRLASLLREPTIRSQP